MTKVLITGGSGYLGQRFTRFLLLSGVDVLFTSRQRLKSHSLNLGYPKNESDYLRLFSNHSFDCLIHLAGLDELKCAESPSDAIKTNVLYTYELLQAASMRNIPRIVYFSTVHVYDSPLRGFYDENTPTFPTHPYGYSKRSAEDIVNSIRKQTGANCTIFRLSNAIGAPVSSDMGRWSLVANDLCLQAIRNKNMVLKSPGSQRDFIPIDDIELTLLKVLKDEAALNGTYNLCSSTSFSILELANLIQNECEKHIGFRPSITTNDIQKDQFTLQLSNRKLELSGHSLKKDFRKSIRETLEFCSQV
ncbi:NAD-dependent epimerase/dehydratase family protein [Pseudobacteriovorax antillogorgiicola]|uniref:UDP-glucose 4-epimerase n=1 Tax=Pseudobacteriovorax antillogorgiicola TaxID=1513793 RepID=A0A1Y6CSR4_9BACT|nr:SDR family oxidoreductase [Pseudobacteriovorax antillogorgiicola]TCS45220.1 UDP-glucose 4-epimerase [Pseudobacteriovorax antillogorgiicola]SMF75418.1 UDP-glucose 4-epimerase [Pseudobacteriovorax antillogorgiicola]